MRPSAAVSLLSLAVGCGIFTSVDRDLVEEEALGGGGAAGAGAFGAGGSECLTADECPGSDDECMSRSCSDNRCGVDVAPPGVPCSAGACDDNGHCAAITRNSGGAGGA